MKAKQNSNANIGLQQKNSIIQAWINLKDSIFNVLFVLLDKSDDEQQQSLWGLAFQSGLDYLQMMAFPFDVAIISVWNGGQTLQNVTALFQKLNISSYLPGVSFGTFLVFLYLLIFLIILVILDIIYVSYSFSKKKFRFTWPLVLLAQIVPLFVTVFFLPMTETLLNVVRCQSTQEGYQVMISFPDVICWEGWHLFHAAVTLLFVSIFVFISSIVALALFEPRMTTNKLTARQNSTAQVVFIMNKIVCQFIFSFTPFSDTWIYCIMLFGFSFWQFWCYMVNEPYYNKKATKFFKIVSAYYFWTTLMLMISQILSFWNFNGGLVIWLGGLPFLFIIILFERKSNIGKLFASNLKFRNGEQLQSHITYVLQLIENQKKDKNSYMLLIGYIQKHKQICTEEDCPFSKYLKKKKKYGQNQMEDNCIQLLKQLQRMYRMGIKKFPQSTKLRLSFAFFHLQRTKNKNKAYQQFSKAQQTDPTFQQQFIIYRFKKIIKQNLQDDNKGGNSDLIQMIRFDNHISLCQEAMLMSARLHKEFWAELKQQIPNLKKLNTIGSKITQTSNAVKQNYFQITKINSSVPQILHNYAVYLLLITEDYSQGRQMLANTKKLYQDKLVGDDKLKDSNDQSFNDKILSPILIISRNEQKLGKIVNCNLMLTQISGYYKEQLCDRDFHKLLPQTYALPHEFTLNDWAKKQNSTSTYFNASNEGFIKQKSGLIVPVIYSVKYNIVEQQFLVHFKLDTTKTTKCLLLADSMGMIKQYSSMARNFLKFQSNGSIDSGFLYLDQLGISNYDNQEYKEGIKKILKFQQKQQQCSVKVRQILMKIDYQMQQGFSQQTDQFLQASKQLVGLVVEITPLVQYQKTQYHLPSYDHLKHKQNRTQNSQNHMERNKHNQVQNRNDNSESQNYNNYSNQNIINQQVMKLYGKPQIADIFLSQFAESKRDEVILRQFQLKDKIKTMRLLNNQIKMVYNQSSENDYNSNRQGFDTEDQRQMFKFDDQNYQSKLRKAINTNINHIQISRLKWMSFIFIILLFIFISLQLVFSVRNLSLIQQFSQNIRKKATEMQYLAKYIQGTLNPLYDQEKYFEQVLNYNVMFDSNMQVPFKLQNRDDLETKSLKDVLILMHSKMVQYFSGSKTYTLQNVYYNFVNYIYGAFVQVPLKVTFDRILPYLFFGLAIFISVFVICFWIYISLLLDKKKYDIMIWFLDIPIPYVTHLSTHCDKYLKQFVGIKQLMQKSVNVDEIDENQYQEYDQKKQENKEQQMQEQIKVRKSLIAKHRKQTLLSKLNFGYLKMFWLLIYSSLISIILIAASQVRIGDYQFLYPHWILTSRHVYWASTLPICMKLAVTNATIGNVNMAEMISTLKLNHLNYISGYNMVDFNKQIIDYNAQLAETFTAVYYDNLCKQSQQQNLTQCKQLFMGRLRAGYSVYSKFLVSVPDSSVDDLRIANQKYVIPALIQVLKSWETIMKQNISTAVNICSILLYVYIIITSFIFGVFWMMYLKKMNTQLNQTIQMLNMIPFKLLPKSRKQTKQFITWIIKQANKKKHESQ